MRCFNGILQSTISAASRRRPQPNQGESQRSNCRGDRSEQWHRQSDCPFRWFFSNFQVLISRFYLPISGGAGRIRTADKQFRKLLLYPSELQPHIFNCNTVPFLVLPHCNTSRPFRSACVFQLMGPPEI